MAGNQTAVRTIRMRAEVEGFAPATAAVEALAKAHYGIASATEVSAKSAGSIAGAFAKQERSLIDGVRAAEQYAKTIRDVSMGVQQTAALQERGNAVLASAAEHYRSVAEAASRAAQAQKQAVQRQVDQQTITPNRAADIQAYGEELDKLQSKYDPLRMAGVQYKRSLEDLNKDLHEGRVSQAQYAAKLTDTKVAFVEQVNTLRGTDAAYQRSIQSQKEFADQQKASAAEIERLKSKYVPLVVAEQAHKKEIDEINKLSRMGHITEVQRTEAVSNSQAAFIKQTKVIKDGVEATQRGINTNRLAGHEVINLSRQIQDVGVGLFSGQALMTVAVQQGTQIADVLANSSGTLKGFAGQVGEWAGRVFTGTRLAAGGVVGLATGAVFAAASWQSTQRDITQSLAGIGKASGVTAKDINQIGDASKSAFGLSGTEARQVASTLAKTGMIGREAILPLTQNMNDLAATMGVDVKDATEAVAKAFAEIRTTGSTASLLELNKATGFLSGTTLDTVQNLIAAGKATQAQKVAADAIIPSLTKASELTGFWGNSWKAVSNGASLLFSDVGEGVSKALGIGQSLAEQYDNVRKEIDLLRANASQGLGLDESLKKAEGAAKALEDQLIKTGMKAIDAANMASGLRAQQATQQAAPEFQGVRNLQQAQSTIQAAGADPNIAANAGAANERAVAEARLAAEIKNRTNADGTAITVEQQATAQHQAEIMGINARTAAEREAAVAAQARAGATGSPIDKDIVAARAVSQEIERRNALYRDTMASLTDQLAVAQAVGGAERLAAQEVAKRNEYLRQGLEPEQAAGAAAKARSVAQEQINAQAKETLFSLKNQAAASAAITGWDKIKEAGAATYRDLVHQGVDETIAMDVATQQVANSQAQATAAVENQITAMKQQAELIRARVKGTEDSVRAEQAYKNALDATGDSNVAARAKSAQEDVNAANRQSNLAAAEKRAADAADKLAERLLSIPWTQGGSQSVLNSYSYTGGGSPPGSPGYALSSTNWLSSAPGPSMFGGPTSIPLGPAITQDDYDKFGEWANDFNFRLNIAGARKQWDVTHTAAGIAGQVDKELTKGGTLQSAINLLNKQREYNVIGPLTPGHPGFAENQAAVIELTKRLAEQDKGAGVAGLQKLIGDLQKQPHTIARDDAIKDLTEKLTELTTSTDDLNSTTKESSQLLSSLYTTDPRLSHIGFRAESGVYRNQAPVSGAMGPSAAATSGLPTVTSPPIAPTTTTPSSQNDLYDRNIPHAGMVWWGAGLAGGMWVPAGSHRDFAFADGGIMTSRGRLPLRKFADGGVADSPQMAMFGEGSSPEAFVPLKDGAIPVTINMAGATTASRQADPAPSTAEVVDDIVKGVDQAVQAIVDRVTPPEAPPAPASSAAPAHGLGPNPTWGQLGAGKNWQPPAPGQSWNIPMVQSTQPVNYTRPPDLGGFQISPLTAAQLAKRERDHMTNFADGGIMTEWGRVPLNKYDGGGVAYTPQLAMFGEGSGPEAFVPLKGGTIPVTIKGDGGDKKEGKSEQSIFVSVTQNFAPGTNAADVKRGSYIAAQDAARQLGGPR